MCLCNALLLEIKGSVLRLRTRFMLHGRKHVRCMYVCFCAYDVCFLLCVCVRVWVGGRRTKVRGKVKK